MRIAFIILILLSASFQGCAGLTPQQQAQNLQAKADYIRNTYSQPCVNIGHQVGTDSHVQCMLYLNNQQEQSDWQLRNFIANGLIGLGRSKPQSPPANSPPSSYYCESIDSPAGSTAYCKPY